MRPLGAKHDPASGPTRKDGSPRQHPHNRCPAKNAGDKVEREFVKNMTAREYA